jgi:hypothetical protein
VQVDGNAPLYLVGGLNHPSTVDSYTVLASGGKYAISNSYIGSTWQSDASGAYWNASRHSSAVSNDTVDNITFNTLPCWFDPGYHMGGIEDLSWTVVTGDTSTDYTIGVPLWDGAYTVPGQAGILRGGYARHAGQFFVAGQIGGRSTSSYPGPVNDSLLTERYPPYRQPGTDNSGGFYQSKFGSPASYFHCTGVTSHLTTRGFDQLYNTRIKTGVETWNFSYDSAGVSEINAGFGSHSPGNGPRLDTFCTMWVQPSSAAQTGVGAYQTTNTDGRASTTPLFCIAKGGSEGMALSIENDLLLPAAAMESAGLSATTMYVPLSALHEVGFIDAIGGTNLNYSLKPWSVLTPYMDSSDEGFQNEDWEKWSSFESMIDYWRVIISPEHNSSIFNTYIKPHISYNRSNRSALWWAPSAGSHLVVRVANRPVCISEQKIYGETWYNPAVAFKYTFATYNGLEAGDIYSSGSVVDRPTWMSNLTGYNLQTSLFNYGDLIGLSDKKMLSTLTAKYSRAGIYGFEQRSQYSSSTDFWDYYEAGKDSEVTIGRGIAGVTSPAFVPIGVLAIDIIGTEINIAGTSYVANSGDNTGPAVRVYTSAAARWHMDDMDHPRYFYIEHKDNPNIGEYFGTVVGSANETVMDGKDVTQFVIDPQMLVRPGISPGYYMQDTTFVYSYPEGSKVYAVDWHGGSNQGTNSLCRFAPARTRIGEVYYGRSSNQMIQPVSGISIDSTVNTWSALFKQWYQYTHGLFIKPTTQYTSTYTAGQGPSASGDFDSDYIKGIDPTAGGFDKSGYLRYGGHDHRQYNNDWYINNAAVVYTKVPPNTALGF